MEWIKDLNLSTKTIKLLEENTGVNLWIQQWFHGYDSNSTANKRKIEKSDFIKIKLLCIKGYYQVNEKTTYNKKNWEKMRKKNLQIMSLTKLSKGKTNN